ncbi:hypothetical protein EDB19DRAFT_1984693 [Suillus lakei]|nr:hypothetical protein EDB19DRAFT_1984693 [Suillus lakei]
MLNGKAVVCDISTTPVKPRLTFKSTILSSRGQNMRQIIGESNSLLVTPGSDSHLVTSPSSSPLLPAEILALILRWDRCEEIEAWREMVNTMVSCSLVSKAWYEAARAVLFQDIRLYNLESLRLLLRTVRERFGGHCPAHALHLSYPWLYLGPREHVMEFRALASEFVACCSKLRHIEGHNGTLNFSSETSLPEYPHLKKLTVSSQYLHLLAPLLHRACNLKSFEVRWGCSGDKLLEHCSPPPSFNLSTLSISQTELSASECKWLFALSFQSIESLEVDDVDVSLCYLAEIIGGFVKNLYIRRADRDFIGSRGIKIISLSGFTSLRRFCVDEWDPRWALVGDNLPSSLETFAIPFCMKVVTNVVNLLRSNWQPSLQSLDVYGIPLDVHESPLGAYESPYYELRPLDFLQSLQLMDRWLRDELQRVCVARGIRSNWLTIQNDTGN